MKQKLLVVLVIAPLFTFAQLTPKSVLSKNGTIGFYEFKPPGYDPDSTYKYPLMIFLHGVGERGNGTSELPRALLSSFPKFLTNGTTMTFNVNGRSHAFLILIPQMSMLYDNWQNFYVDAMIDYAKANLNVDTNRIFLSGWSVGGGGAWKYATASLENANRLAGIIPVSPAPDYTNLCNVARGNVAVWVHHAKNDGAVPLHFTEDALEGINNCTPSIPPMVTYYIKGGHHRVADWAYDTLNSFYYPNIFQWMIGTSKNNTRATNKKPVPVAGKDSVIVLPSSRTVLNGNASFDPNDVIIKYGWTVISGPSLSRLRIMRPNYIVTDVLGLEPGAYTFRLTVMDQFGATSFDDLSVTVSLPPRGQNAIPLVDLGPDIRVGDPNYQVRGKVKDFDGHIQRYHWRQINGPVSVTIVQEGNFADIIGMTSRGTYSIELSAFDNHKPNGTGRDTLLITKDFASPVHFFYSHRKNNMRHHTYGFDSFSLSMIFVIAGTVFLWIALFSSVAFDVHRFSFKVHS